MKLDGNVRWTEMEGVLGALLDGQQTAAGCH